MTHKAYMKYVAFSNPQNHYFGLGAWKFAFKFNFSIICGQSKENSFTDESFIFMHKIDSW